MTEHASERPPEASDINADQARPTDAAHTDTAHALTAGTTVPGGDIASAVVQPALEGTVFRGVPPTEHESADVMDESPERSSPPPEKAAFLGRTGVEGPAKDDRFAHTVENL